MIHLSGRRRQFDKVVGQLLMFPSILFEINRRPNGIKLLQFVRRFGRSAGNVNRLELQVVFLNQGCHHCNVLRMSSSSTPAHENQKIKFGLFGGRLLAHHVVFKVNVTTTTTTVVGRSCSSTTLHSFQMRKGFISWYHHFGQILEQWTTILWINCTNQDLDSIGSSRDAVIARRKNLNEQRDFVRIWVHGGSCFICLFVLSLRSNITVWWYSTR